MGTIVMLLVLSAPPAQTRTSNPDTTGAGMQELVNEVRLLRQSLERSTAVNFRAQVLLQRMQLQNQRVVQAAARLNDVRNQLTHLISEQATFAEAMRILQDRAAKEQDPLRRKQGEDQLAEDKIQMERSTRMEAQFRGQESEAETAWRKEQAVWDELSQQIATLEQSLAPAPAARPQ